MNLKKLSYLLFDLVILGKGSFFYKYINDIACFLVRML